jgi:hypothetical protein
VCVCVCILRPVEPKARLPKGIGRPAACLFYLYYVQITPTRAGVDALLHEVAMENGVSTSRVRILIGLLAVLVASLVTSLLLTYRDFLDHRFKNWHHYLAFGHNLSVIASLVVGIVANIKALIPETEVKWLDTAIICATILLSNTNVSPLSLSILHANVFADTYDV